jgi:carbon-monoxide dehydrogenase small subunit
VHPAAQAVKSRTVPAKHAEGPELTTLEALAANGSMHPLQTAFWEKHGLQCGFCTPGVIMCAADLLASNPSPTEAEVRHSLEGNLGRCTGYQNTVDSLLAAADTRRGTPARAS